jgi:hypothetical protein
VNKKNRFFPFPSHSAAVQKNSETVAKEVGRESEEKNRTKLLLVAIEFPSRRMKKYITIKRKN